MLSEKKLFLFDIDGTVALGDVCLLYTSDAADE